MRPSRDGLARAWRWVTRGDGTAAALLGLSRTGPGVSPARRAAVASLLFAFGIALGDALALRGVVAPSALLFAVAGALALLGVALRGRYAAGALAVSIVLAGGGRVTSGVHERAADDLSRVLTVEDAIVRVEGTVVGPVETRRTQAGALARYSFGGASTGFRLRADALVGLDGGRSDASGTLLVRVGEADAPVAPGERVRVTGLASALRPPSNPGGFEAARWGATSGVSGRVRIDSSELIEPLGKAPRPTLMRGVIDRADAWLRARTGAWLDGADESPERALLAAMLLGERTDALEDSERTFRRVGLAHVLAISGLHLAAMIALALGALRLSGDRPRLHALILLVALAAYLLIVPVRTPIVRASILSVALIVSELAGRRYDRLNLLGWVMIAVLVWKPTELFGAGFHLSFGIVAALMTLVAPFRARIFGTPTPPDERTARSRASDWGKDLLCASIVAWAVSLPIVAHHFGVVSLVGVPATLIVLPVVTVLLAFAYAALALGLVWAPMGAALLHVIDPIASGVLWVVGVFEELPFAELGVHAPPVWWSVLAVGCLAWWLTRGTVRAPIGWALTPALVLSAALTWTSAGVPRSTALRIDVLDVGDGTCYLLRTPRDAVLFDCGSRYPGVGLSTIPDALRTLGVRAVRAVVVSHPNTDHFNGLPDFAERFGVREVITCAAFGEIAREDPDGAPAALLAFCEGAGVALRSAHAGDEVRVGTVVFAVLSPDAGEVFEGVNDNSLVLRAAVETGEGTRSVLLTGDIEREAIERLLVRYPDLRADIAEVPHHGSARPSAMAFIEAIDPKIALQSTGPSRLDDERWDDVRAGRVWLVTARDGALRVTIRRDGGVETGVYMNTRR